MAKIFKLRGPIREFTVAVGAYSRGGGLLIICSSRVGCIRGGFFEGGAIRGFTVGKLFNLAPLIVTLRLQVFKQHLVRL